MPLFTVHQRPEPEAEPLLVREGFSGWALLLAPLWFLRFGLWPALAGYALLLAAVMALFAPGDPLLPAALTVLHFACGLAAHDLRRWWLARSGIREIAVIEATSEETAFARLVGHGDYAGWRAAARPARGAVWTPWAPGGDSP